MTCDGLPITEDFSYPVGDSIPGTFEFIDVPVVGTGLAGFTLSGEVRVTVKSTGAPLLDLSTGGRLTLSGNIVTLFLSEADTKELGEGVFHYAIRARNGTLTVTLVVGKIDLRMVADHT